MLSAKLSKELASVLETKIVTFLKKNRKAIIGTPTVAAGRATKAKRGRKPAAAAAA